jgi:hypothetical protein
MSDSADDLQRPAHLFKPGQSGNPKGRSKGSRNKLGEAFVSALHDDFVEYGPATIAKVRQEDPAAYVRVCASILPKELNVRVDQLEDLSDAELDQRIRQLATAIGLEVGAGKAPAGTEAETRAEQAVGVSTLQ